MNIAVDGRKFRVTAAGRMFEKELARGAGESRQQLDQIARGAFEGVPPGREQIEGKRHARQEVRREPLRIDERADFSVGSFTASGMDDLGREEIAASLARRFRDPASEFAALAVFTDIPADREVPVLAPERLEQTRGRPEPRIERFVDAMFLEDVCGDERQLVNGLAEFRGHASRSNGHEADSDGGGGNLQRAARTDGISEVPMRTSAGSVHFLWRPPGEH
jgi:hypothetical protein